MLRRSTTLGTKALKRPSIVFCGRPISPKRCMTLPPPGSGAGKGGGAGGSVKESGGGLGRYGAAQEEGYFYNKTREQLEKLKKKLQSDEPPKKDK